jgi:hypothetical protein
MSSIQLPQGRNGISFAALFTIAVASALTGAVVALIVQRFAERGRVIEVLPAPTPIRHLADGARVAPATGGPAHTAAAQAPSALGAVAGKLSTARVAELERLLAEDDVIAGDGSDICPAEFPIKANGRSGIYHWPGALAYAQTHPTLCFRSAESADRAGFRPAKR